MSQVLSWIGAWLRAVHEWYIGRYITISDAHQRLPQNDLLQPRNMADPRYTIDPVLAERIRRLPVEIQFQIVKVFIRSEETRQCSSSPLYDYACSDDVAPHTRLTSISPMLCNEAHLYFYQTQKLSFSRLSEWMHCGATKEERYSTLESWQELRDPRATRILVFTDRPEWKDKGSSAFLKIYKNDPSFFQAHNYRYHITRLVVQTSYNVEWYRQLDWDWPLKVDWTTLPKLQFLGLGLHAFCGRRRLVWEDGTRQVDIHRLAVNGTEQEDIQRLVAGAEKMYHLRLKHLLLIGLCSEEYWDDSLHKQFIVDIFTPALGMAGKLSFRDVEWSTVW